MALSTYHNNWYTLQPPNSVEIITFHEEESLPELAPHHNNFFYLDESFFLPCPYFDPTSLANPEVHPSQLLYCTSNSHNEDLNSINEKFPTEEGCNFLLPYPKRQKCCYEEEELLHSSLQEVSSSNFLDEIAPIINPPSLQQAEELPELFSAVQEFNNKVTHLPPNSSTCVGIVDVQCDKKKEANERTISTQSIAARERRRKITEKTQELGKLVPGGPKMNTAEMLHAAAKYVKYLQAQIGMLQLMNTLKEDKAAPPTEDLHTLLVSPFVQEKLYSEEKCFVPKDFVTTLTNYDDVRSKPIVLEDLKQLIGTDIEKKPKQE